MTVNSNANAASLDSIVMDSEDDDIQKEIEETTKATKAALDEILNSKPSSESEFLKYLPSQQSAAVNSGAKERIIKIVQTPVDPLDPLKFKHKRIPRGTTSPPVPVIHSPPRPVTIKDQQDWTIQPCISNWKNPKGYTIPLDKRVGSDGRGLEEIRINDNFANFSKALYVAEEKARESVAMRSKVRKEMAMKEKEKKEAQVRDLAAKALSERRGVAVPLGEVSDGKKILQERKREREREKKLEGKKSKISRDSDRDVSEKVALGMTSVGGGRGEVIYDERLFNQEKGMGSGFVTDDQYKVYDGGLYNAQATLSTLYRPNKDLDSEVYGGDDEELEKIKKTGRFKPDRAFAGTSEKGGPAQEEGDPFGLDRWLTELKKG